MIIQDSESTKTFLPNPNVRGGRSCYSKKPAESSQPFKETDRETFLYEATTPAGNNWGQTVEVNECHPAEQRALDQAVKEQAHEHPMSKYASHWKTPLTHSSTSLTY